ncbi:MAG: hypothetical protein NUV60_03535 [Patescibacteria group bacterium]|nr:hypothetical protein [Patescibacteria group bacterium]
MEKRLMRPYFAHAVNSYDTRLEVSWVKALTDQFKICEESVENPNQPHHQEGYTLYAKRASLAATNHKGMNYFYDEVLPKCDSCVAMPFLDGRVGLGVAGEMKWFITEGLPVFVMDFDKDAITPDSLRAFEENHQSGLFKPRPLTEEEKILVMADDPRLVVPHIETRLRTFLVYGKEKRPFETAHLVSLPVPPGFYPDKK